MKKIWKLSCHRALKQPYSNYVYEQLKTEGKTASEALQIISICSQINNLVNRPEKEKSPFEEEAPENSLSVNTSDADGIESEYYVDDAIDKKVTSMNKNFEDRVKLMTKVIIDRIEESSSSDEYQNLVKVNRKHPYYVKSEDGCQTDYLLNAKRKYMNSIRTKHEPGHSYKRQRTDNDDYSAFEKSDSPSYYHPVRSPLNLYPQSPNEDAYSRKAVIYKKHSNKSRRKRRNIDYEKEARRIKDSFVNSDLFQTKRVRANDSMQFALSGDEDSFIDLNITSGPRNN